MLDFAVNRDKCTKCGLCVADCPAMIIAMDETSSSPAIAEEKEAACYRCQHCLAVCPSGAISILGHDPETSMNLPADLPGARQMEDLIKSRRSVRHYREENLDPALLQRLLDATGHAPSGMNARQVRLTVVDNRERLAQLRDEAMTGLGRLVRENALPEGMEFYADFVQFWETRQIDVIFRGAPHLLIASAPRSVVTPEPDCLIALSYFDLFAQSQGVGTLWNGLAKWTFNDLLPEMKKSLGIPDDHLIGYVMAFGKPAVRYARTAQHTANIHRIS